MNANAVELDRVSLARGERIVLQDVSLAIGPSELIGVFGPNGAGKTTFLHAILGLVRPTAGEVRVFGKSPAHGNREAGYLPQQRGATADLHLRGWDFVASAVRGGTWGLASPGRAGAADVDRVIATVQGEQLAHRPLCQLSGGEMQRLFLAQALLGRPRLVLLDEPLISLDPHFQRAIVALVKRIQQSEGITVLFTAHEVNPLLGAMDRVLYLGHRHAALGSADEVITAPVLSRLYATPIDVLRVDGRVVVVSGHGAVEADAHRHDA